MTRRIAVAAGGVLVLGGAGVIVARAKAAPTRVEARVEAQRDKVSYGMGVALARTFQRQRFDVDVDLLARGMRDALARGKLLASEEDLRQAIGAYKAELKRRLEAAAGGAKESAAVESKARGPGE